MEGTDEMDFLTLAAGHQVAAINSPLAGPAYIAGGLERFRGLPVARGTLTRVTDSWFQCADDPRYEFREAILRIDCEACGRQHWHGWHLGHPIEHLGYRVTACRVHGATGFYVGVLPPPAVHVVPPDVAIRRPVRRRRSRGAA